MRLIDADALKKILEETKDEYFGLYQAIKAIDNAPTIPIQRDVWELYQRHQSHLGTYVYEFGVELKELLGRYEKGGRQ